MPRLLHRGVVYVDVVNYLMKKVCALKEAFILNCWHCEHAQMKRHVLEKSVALSLSERRHLCKATDKKMHSNVTN